MNRTGKGTSTGTETDRRTGPGTGAGTGIVTGRGECVPKVYCMQRSQRPCESLDLKNRP